MPIYPRPYYQILGDKKIKYPQKENGEIRLLSMDVATAGGSKNDATAISIMQMVPAGGTQYIRNVVYMETIDGGHGQDQAIRVRQLYDDFDVDYVVIDTNGRDAHPIGDSRSVTRKKTGTLRWKPEWKATFKSVVTRNAQAVILRTADYNRPKSSRNLDYRLKGMLIL